MPTGYTAAIYEGKDVTFEEFILGCARAFGALVLMRDDPADAPIPDEFEPASYYTASLERAQERLAEVSAWTLSDAMRELDAENDRIRVSNEATALRCAKLRNDYEAMLGHVRAWIPPSEEHVGLKDFMVEQLEKSIEFDAKPYEQPLRTPNPWAYRQEEFETAQKRVSYAESERDKEIERAAGRTRWVQELRKSLEASRATNSQSRGDS